MSRLEQFDDTARVKRLAEDYMRRRGKGHIVDAYEKQRQEVKAKTLATITHSC